MEIECGAVSMDYLGKTNRLVLALKVGIRHRQRGERRLPLNMMEVESKPMTKEICGEENKDGSRCQRESGWGTDRNHGPCIDHKQDRPVLRKFTAERREQIIGAAQTGAFKKHCAQLAEIDQDTLQRWLKMGEKDEQNGLDTELADFYTDWQRARGMGAIKTLQNVNDEFLAERAYGYTKKERHEHLVDGEADLQSNEPTSELVIVESIDDEQEQD